MNDYLVEGRKILQSQPFSLLMGTELNELGKGFSGLSLNLKEDFFQNHGFVHGGVISYLADTCLTFAGATILGNCVTSEFKINYLLPGQGNKLITKSTVVSHTLRQAVCECKIYSVNSKQSSHLIAIALGTIVKVESNGPRGN